MTSDGGLPDPDLVTPEMLAAANEEGSAPVVPADGTVSSALDVAAEVHGWLRSLIGAIERRWPKLVGVPMYPDGESTMSRAIHLLEEAYSPHGFYKCHLDLAKVGSSLIEHFPGTQRGEDGFAEWAIDIIKRHYGLCIAASDEEEHEFACVHKDREHAIILDERTGVVRVLELVIGDTGRPGVLDVPRPGSLPADWPGIGVGLEDRETRIEGIAHLRRIAELCEDLPDPPQELRVLLGVVEEYLEGLDG